MFLATQVEKRPFKLHWLIILKVKVTFQYKVVERATQQRHLEVINLEDGFWVRQVILLQVCVQAGSRGAKVRDPSCCRWIRCEELYSDSLQLCKLQENESF